MKNLNEDNLNALLQGARVIEEDGYGIKVACLANGDYLKLYRRKRLLSSALWAPPARRFAANAERLRQLDIPAPFIVETLQVPSRQLNGVRYQPLPGDTLRNHWRSLDDEQRAGEVQRFGAFLGQLHEFGVYFRSLHLGNVLTLPDDRFGLIDLSDMQISGRPLPRWKRQRNLQHMLRYAEDSHWLTVLHRQSLLSGYAQYCGQGPADRLARALCRLQGPGEH
ncbi:Lipopolysaccharide kinase (Kdo/WaaP) family protein [Geopseudomonas sagittaria]|uniref:Lipopolysaccharide kinase (Kdo/WaaP) family protein n=1 Tax=Geopseudomonas sagittaria TaxID=1135990 RepID=A0A1I5SZG9_9GAMM|nr:lipopolysaccharide kinase InaA family protein [Pseudomonas sagittaria]SFP76021.1 Lipopolysaccharide kinase (Kdo/WaaP) family protein [Pseudomonas sagittaria]